MIAPRPSVERLVRTVVNAEAEQGGAGTDSRVAQRVMTRLHQELGKLLGSAGFDVLLARSLVLAARANPSLAGITAGPGGTLTGLDDPARDNGQGDRAISIVSHFIELLFSLIGEDLTLRLVGDLWPEAIREEAET